MNPLLPIVFIAVIAGTIIYLSIMVEKRRTSAWEAVAQRLGAQFHPRDSGLQALFPFQLFNTGSSRKMKNHLTWESQGVIVHLGDYHYTTFQSTGRGRSSKTHKQTICILEKEGLELPRTYLRRQVALLDWVGEKFGAQDINFLEDPDFSKAFVLKGDEVQTPMVFGPDLRSYVLQNRKAFRTMEMSGSALLVNFGKRRKPDEYADLVQAAMPMYYMVTGSSQGW